MAKFSKAQEEAIAQVMVDRWGCNFQTGYGERSGTVYIYSQRALNGPPMRRVEIDKEGTVSYGDA